METVEEKGIKRSNLLLVVLGGSIVFFMQTGFALLEAGSIRMKNNDYILLKNLMDACVCGMVWWATGYGFAFGKLSEQGLIGTSKFFCSGFGPGNNEYARWFHSWVFAANASTIVSGALAERVNVYTYLVFSAFMCGFIYPTIAAWAWNTDDDGVKGYLLEIGFMDTAGGGVVHLTGGVASLVGAAILGPRLGVF